MHDALFELSPALEPANLEAAAQKLGLDARAVQGRHGIRRDPRSHRSRPAARDRPRAPAAPPPSSSTAASSPARIPSTPSRPSSTRSSRKAEALVKSGTPAAQVYEAIIAKGADRAGPGAPSRPPHARRPGAAAGGGLRKVPVRADDPVRGPADAPVTIVVFSDFQCPFCGRVEPTLKQLEETYAGKVRFVWKHQPLPFHPNADAGGRSRPRRPTSRASSGRCTTSSSRTSRPSTARRPRALRRGARPRHGQVQGRRWPRARAQARIEADQQLAAQRGRERHADLLLQRPAARRRRSPSTAFEAGHRRGARQGGRAAQAAARPGRASTRRPATPTWRWPRPPPPPRQPPRRAPPRRPCRPTPSSCAPDDPVRGRKNAPVTIVRLLRLPVPVLQPRRADARRRSRRTTATR